MTDRELLELLVQKVTGVEERMVGMEKELQNIKASQVRIEQDHGTKITALFDGYTLRGDQIEQLQAHLDERLDEIHTDVSFLVGKAAQHDRRFIQLRKDDSMSLPK